ncbi:hypothetical protein HPB51_022486 [Rhipicephalus microplus]|uniref:Uncharacterized protein n=1 Tax=Rhipicephalus microplus TaxID=6941 RepID=A0A9J6ECC1_RHIMP|nr:hypothetical protein HPB51_022486 [Rhipicephalus microplus]
MSGRKRFSLSDDIALVKEVLYVNPFLDPARWLKIADRLSEVLGRYFNIRSVRERLNLILLRFLRDQKKKIKSSGTEEEQSELEDLLQQAADIARECGYTPPPSTARQLAERDGIKKRASGNSVARPPAKRRVDNKEEDALAAYAEFTAGDGVEPADDASTSQAQTLLNSLYEPENIEIHMDLPDCELEDNPTASCPAPDRIATAAPSRAQTPTSSPSDVAAAGPQRHAEATYALIQARCDRDTAIENHRLQLEQGRLQFEQDRLRFKIKCHKEKMKLREMELQQRQAEQEAQFKLRELELEALAEERRHNRSYQEAQLEIIKSFINK